MNVEMDNAAFEDEDELPRLLHLTAYQIERGCRDGRVLDANGNAVGHFLMERDPDDEEET